MGLIKKLAANNIDDMKMIGAIETADDMAEIVKLCKLSFPEKLNLKAVINELSNKQSIVDPEELKAIDSMQTKLRLIDDSIVLIAATTQKIDDESAAHSKQIKETFNALRTSLSEREKKLLDKVHQIATEKKKKLEEIGNNLKAHSTQFPKKIESCQKLLKKPIELSSNVMEQRKANILNMAKEMNDVKVINKTDSEITSNGINVRMNNKLLIDAINAFGQVSSAILPVLISLKDNKENGVVIQWKVNGTMNEKQQNNKSHKIGIEWMDTQNNKTLDDEKEEKNEWKEQEFELNKIEDMNEQILNVDFDAKIAFIAVRLRIFYENDSNYNWSLRSNEMTIKMESTQLPNGLKSVLIKGNLLKTMMMKNVLMSTLQLRGKRFELLLRGSEHGLSKKVFNERCTDKGATLIIVKSDKYERIFGGYVPVPWKKGNAEWQKDPDKKTFVFYLSAKEKKAEKFHNKNAAYAIYCNTSYGVYIGGGGNIYWYPDGTRGTCNRGSYFDYSKATDKTPLAGGTGWNVADYEVWKVI